MLARNSLFARLAAARSSDVRARSAFVEGRELFVGGREFVVGRAELLVHRRELLVGEVQLLGAVLHELLEVLAVDAKLLVDLPALGDVVVDGEEDAPLAGIDQLEMDLGRVGAAVLAPVSRLEHHVGLLAGAQGGQERLEGLGREVRLDVQGRHGRQFVLRVAEIAQGPRVGERVVERLGVEDVDLVQASGDDVAQPRGLTFRTPSCAVDAGGALAPGDADAGSRDPE
jgi:hypothetical protein